MPSHHSSSGRKSKVEHKCNLPVQGICRDSTTHSRHEQILYGIRSTYLAGEATAAKATIPELHYHI